MINQENLRKFIKWANLTAIFSIVFGALAAISIVGIIPGVLMIIAGFKLLNAKRAADELVGVEDSALLTERFNNVISQSTEFFKYQGIYYIVSLILGVIGIIAYIGIIVAFISNAQLY